MNDDIVMRLRGLKTTDVFLLCNEAADEIEGLRKEYEHCRLQMLMYQRIAELGPYSGREEI